VIEIIIEDETSTLIFYKLCERVFSRERSGLKLKVTSPCGSVHCHNRSGLHKCRCRPHCFLILIFYIKSLFIEIGINGLVSLSIYFLRSEDLLISDLAVHHCVFHNPYSPVLIIVGESSDFLLLFNIMIQLRILIF
jgi:hypothetical protein